MKSNSFIPFYLMPTIHKGMTLFQECYLNSPNAQSVKLKPIDTLPSLIIGTGTDRFVASSYASQFQAICKLGSFVCITLALGWSIQAIIKQYNGRQH